MKIDDCLPPGFEPFAGSEIIRHGYLPAAAAYCRKLGLVRLIDRMVPTKMLLRPGLTVQTMVLDTLSGRTPLYRLESFLAEEDAELLLGEEVEAKDFNDTNLGRSLDIIFEAGPSKIITELGIVATRTFELNTESPSYDTTSNSVWGEYALCEQEVSPPGPVISHGHSKDHLPHLKQFMMELLCVDRGVPIFGGTLNGNSSDKTSNNKMLSRIGKIMTSHGLGPGAFVYVADSAMVTEDNLNAVGSNLFVTRLPATYSECGAAIAKAVDSETWNHIGELAEYPSAKSRPHAQYKTFETSVNLHGKFYRAVVVHSTSHDKRRQKKLDKAIAASAKTIENELKTRQNTYFCEADALQAAKCVEKLSTRLHNVVASVVPEEVRKRGRPPENAPPATKVRYKLTWEMIENTGGVERQRTLAGCFVLITNVPAEKDPMAMDARKILQIYKGQYGVESDFVFLKDPLIVNDLFLKKPARIEVLGMVLIIALMIWRLMERSMRNHVDNNEKTLPGWDGRTTKRPTTFMMTTYMKGITTIIIKGKRHLLRSPKAEQLAFLEALGVGPPAFTDPGYKCRPIIQKKNK